MSGKNQHFIPRSLLRGFLAARSGEENVWVYRRDKVFNPSLGGVAAQRFFYSELAIDGARTLDDTITEYETGLNDKIQYLRDRTGTDTIDPAQVAEVIAHLTIRNAHTRSVMSHGLRHFVVNATALFSDEVAIRNLIGFDNDAPNSKFSKMVLDILQKEPRLAQHGISPEALLPISIALAKEGLPEFIKQQSPILRGLLAQFYFQADQISRDSHVKALAQGVVPELRVDALSKLHWRVEETTRPLILPDCVALCIDEGAQILPLLLADADKLGLVLMPISATKLLVGECKPVPGFALEHFNLLAAACSETFFVANANTADFQKHRAIIGTTTTGALDKAVKEAIDELTAAAQPAVDIETNDDLLLVPVPAEPREPLPPLPLSLHLLGINSREAADKISGQVQAIVGAIYSLIPLERLDGITFAKDYAQAIADVSGQPSAPFATEYGEGVSMAVRVKREGVTKIHLVIQLGKRNVTLAFPVAGDLRYVPCCAID